MPNLSPIFRPPACVAGRRRRMLWAKMLLGLLALAASGQPARAATEKFFIQEYLVEGADRLPRLVVEETVYPFLGPDRTSRDVERARAALEAAYQSRGFQTVTVQIPEQPTGPSVRLVVTEVPVGRLRVRGAVYSPPSGIKALAPSVAEGKVMNFQEVTQDIAALNELPDRQVTPSIHSGAMPGTVDVDLEVKEKSPVHASVELDNRRGPNTEPLRLTMAVSDNNIAQSGNAVGLSFQNSPQKPSQVAVLSAYYLARSRTPGGVGLMVEGSKQNSNVSTLGTVAVAGRGQTLGVRANFSLPSEADFFQSASVGIDYKHFNQEVNVAAAGTTPASVSTTPITYYPLSATYAATWQAKHASTELNGGVTFHVRGTGGTSAQFNNNRFGADSNFLALRGDLSHTHDLPAGFQAFAKVQGQLADQPLVSNEQLSGGGSGTVRGYLEAVALGDSGLFGSVELRTPTLAKWFGRTAGDWRIFGFYDAGFLRINQPLSGQTGHFDLASYGVGSRLQLANHFDGSVDAGFPRAAVGPTTDKSVRVTFRAGLNY